MRRNPVWFAIAVVASSCPPAEQPEPPKCGDLEWFDLSGCPGSTLGDLRLEGAWNMEFESHASHAAGGAHSSGAFSFIDPGQSILLGQPARVAHDANSFLIDTDFTSSTGPVRFAFAGCKAPSSEEVEGSYAMCSAQSVVQGSFRAKRIRRIAGEGEAQNLTLLGEMAFPGARTADVFVSGALAYVVLFRDGAAIVDVTNPSAPALVTRISSNNEYWNAVWVKDQILYLASAERGVVFYDVANPAAPVRLGAVPNEPINVHTLFLLGNTLYAMSPFPNAETLLFDVTQAGSPALLSRLHVLGAGFPHDGTAFDGRLYINHWSSGLVVADVSDPTRPSELGRFSYASATSHASKVGAFAGRTIVFEGGESWGAHLRVLDATNPGVLTEIGAVSLRPEVSIHNLELRGTRLYVAWYQDGLRAFDVSTPAAPRSIGYFNTWRESDPGRGMSFYEGAIGVRAPGDGRIYMAETHRGLLIFAEPP